MKIDPKTHIPVVSDRITIRTIRYDAIEEINLDSKAEYTA